MNDDQLKKLFQAAREVKPDTSRAEYGFETRLLARLRAEHAPSTPWHAVVWKLMPMFAAIVVALGVWTAVDPGASSSDLQSALSSDHEDKTLVSYLTGESQ